jgi:uncharacterized membrane protein YqiK
MEPLNLIVMRDLIQNHQQTRVDVAIDHKNRINKERETAHAAAANAAKAAGTAAPAAPANVNNTSEEVARATYDTLHADQAKYAASVARYNELAKQFDKNTNN